MERDEICKKYLVIEGNSQEEAVIEGEEDAMIPLN